LKAYRFITGDDNSEFCHRVSEALSNDWELYGKSQIFFDPILGKMRCAQAVVKESKKKYSKKMKLSLV